MHTPRHYVATLFAAAAACMPLGIQAAGLGEATVRSALAQPLRAEIQLVGADAGELTPDCLRLRPGQAGDDLPWITDASIQIARQGGSVAAVVSGRRPVSHPVVMLGVTLGCGVQMKRDYALLLGPTVAGGAEALDGISPPTLAPAAAPASRPSVPSRGTRWQAQAGDSAAGIAALLRPDDRSGQRRLAGQIVAANPDAFPDGADRALPADAQLDIPASRTSTARRTPPPVPAGPRVLPRSTENGRDRLSLLGGHSEPQLRASLMLGDAGPPGRTTGDAERDQLRREQQLVLALDDKIASGLALDDRVRQLEAIQARLNAENKRLQAQLDALQPRSPRPAPQRDTPWALIAAGLGACGLAVIGIAGWRRRAKASVHSLADAGPDPGMPDPDADLHLEPLTTADIWPDDETRQDAPGAAPALDWSPPTVLPNALGPSSLLHIDDSIEEHDSAVELAEIMMSFGRVQGAAETLAEFIRANPKQSVRPWIKLMEVYKAAGMRMEFDALAHRLNKTFNVKAVTWEEFDQIKAGTEVLEQMPHIVGQITANWGTRDSQAYVARLLRDNRKGTRQGFPIGIVDDLLCLSGVLEILLGPYKPTPEELAAIEHGETAPAPAPPKAQPGNPALMPDIILDGPETESTFVSPPQAPADDVPFEFSFGDDLPAKPSPRRP